MRKVKRFTSVYYSLTQFVSREKAGGFSGRLPSSGRVLPVDSDLHPPDQKEAKP